MKIHSTVKHKKCTLLPDFVRIYLNMTKSCCFSQDDGLFLSILIVVFTSSLLVAVKRASLLMRWGCRLGDGELLQVKSLDIGINGLNWKNKVWRLQGVWVDNVEDWCRASLQELSYCAWDRTKWSKTVKEALDSSGWWAEGWWWWWWWWWWQLESKYMYQVLHNCSIPTFIDNKFMNETSNKEQWNELRCMHQYVRKIDR